MFVCVIESDQVEKSLFIPFGGVKINISWYMYMCIHLYNQTHAHTVRMVTFASWQRGLRRGSAAERLLGLWVRIPLRTCIFVQGVKRPRSYTDHSPPVSAKVKNEWSLISTPLICLDGVEGETIIFIFDRLWVLRDNESTSSHMIVANVDCCVVPYSYRVQETS